MDEWTNGREWTATKWTAAEWTTTEWTTTEWTWGITQYSKVTPVLKRDCYTMSIPVHSSIITTSKSDTTAQRLKA